IEARGPADVVIPSIPENRHWTRDVVTTNDGRLFVAIGSGSNIAGGMPAKTPQEVKAWEATHGVGAAWGDEENRAVVRVFDAEGKQVKNYATGLRNCSGLAVQPGTNDVWCAVNERDHLGNNVEPRLKGQRPDLNGKVTVPDVLLEAHTAPLGITFYTGKQFPAEYQDS